MNSLPMVARIATVIFCSACAANGQSPTKSSVIVAADGSGDFRTVAEAINAAPNAPARLFLIHLKPGIYQEKLSVPSGKGPIKMIGDEVDKTIITFNDSAKTLDAYGKEIGTFASGTFTIYSTDFTAEKITFANSFGEGAQAVAMEVYSDHSTFRDCRFIGWQDTLFANTGRHFFTKCYIEGRTDFIFGAATVYFDDCEIHCMAKGYITAPSTPENHSYGFVFSRCRITAPPGDWKTFLGRPWRPYGSTTFLETTMSDYIRPEGWDNWQHVENEKTARFSEYNSQGPGANPDARVTWSHQLTSLQASALTPLRVLSGWEPDLTLTAERIASLPEGTRAEWEAYLDRSQKLQVADKAVLAEEVATAKLTEPLKPPTNGDFKLPSHLTPEWFGSPETIQMAEAALSFQIPSGGWSKKVAMTKGLRQPGMHWSAQCSAEDLWHYVGTFDNRTTTEHMHLLAGVYGVTKDARYSAAFLKGLDYIFNAQFPNGGWPQVYPLEGGYHNNITYNDDAMVHILELLQEIANGSPNFAFVDATRRAAAAKAMDRGVQCILDTQVEQNGTLTVWCAQHEPLSLVPIRARLMEPASLTGGESEKIVEFLMSLPNPSKRIVQAVNASLTWFEHSKVTHLRKKDADGHTMYETDTESQEVYWARFYDLATNEPIFSGAQDGCIYKSYAEMAKDNTTGYDYYTRKPLDLITKLEAKWRKKLASASGKQNP